MSKEFAGRGVRFLALSVESDEDLVRSGVKKLGMQLPVGIADSDVESLGVDQVPATLFVDTGGRIVASVNGEREAAFLRRRIKELLSRTPPAR